MELVDGNEVKWYRFPRLATFSGLVHGIFTRQGGVSSGPYHSLNVSLAVGDLPPRVEENRRYWLRCWASSSRLKEQFESAR